MKHRTLIYVMWGVAGYVLMAICAGILRIRQVASANESRMRQNDGESTRFVNSRLSRRRMYELSVALIGYAYDHEGRFPCSNKGQKDIMENSAFVRYLQKENRDAEDDVVRLQSKIHFYLNPAVCGQSISSIKMQPNKVIWFSSDDYGNVFTFTSDDLF